MTCHKPVRPELSLDLEAETREGWEGPFKEDLLCSFSMFMILLSPLFWSKAWFAALIFSNVFWDITIMSPKGTSYVYFQCLGFNFWVKCASMFPKTLFFSETLC